LEEKYFKLIEKQIDKLSAEDFDLDAWKSSAVYALRLIFGEKDPKIEEIKSLKIDYSSWALRDASSTYRPVEMCKKKGREIMEIAKDELELNGASNSRTLFEEQLKNLLSTDQYKKFIDGATTPEERAKILKSLNKDQLISLVNSFYWR